MHELKTAWQGACQIVCYSKASGFRPQSLLSKHAHRAQRNHIDLSAVFMQLCYVEIVSVMQLFVHFLISVMMLCCKGLVDVPNVFKGTS
jgi:hypothetical protein